MCCDAVSKRQIETLHVTIHLCVCLSGCLSVCLFASPAACLKFETCIVSQPVVLVARTDTYVCMLYIHQLAVAYTDLTISNSI